MVVVTLPYSFKVSIQAFVFHVKKPTKRGCASLFRGIVSLIKRPAEFEFSPGIVLGILRFEWFLR